MRCPRCGNVDPSWFYLGSKGWYCRRCVGFSRRLACEAEEPAVPELSEPLDPQLRLDYPLTSNQKQISDQLCELSETHDVLVDAVCGAGKTEIVMDCLRKRLQRGQRAAVAVARRQVVLELARRLADAFPNLSVIPVCQGYTKKTEADLIVCTTHQLYRYPHRFDLLILDEPDAFPYKGDPVLHGIARTSCRGQIVYTTATPDAELQGRVKAGTLRQLKLNRRPHGHDLTVPRVLIGPQFLLILQLYHWLKNKQKADKQALIFVPTIRGCHRLKVLFSLEFSCGELTSQSPDQDETLRKLRAKELQFCFATTVLERGVTIAGVDVCVMDADHGVFDEASLTQMIGRVGRSFACPDGDGLFLCRRRSEQVERCVKRLEEANADG
ncbi:helicase-related protein [Holdemania filiformis]|uniref:helicase-related protein n=1 Tax=Holdemania filiformis TaxID=61171 RepID=UPI0026706AB8|nr:helicase-related protein [Holdemania filiformis]